MLLKQICNSTNILQNFASHGGSPSVISQHYSSKIKIQFKPAKKGSCHIKHDGGYTHRDEYRHLIDPSRGLAHLEIYHNHAT